MQRRNTYLKMAKKKKQVTDLSTEDKIKEAARSVFTKKGYAATRTRDIAEEAGINLALLNYYFRSKEKLFEIVMVEKIGKFFGAIGPVLNDTTISLEDKIISITAKYTDLLTANPDIPLFILSEIRMNPDQFINKIPVRKVLDSHFIKQVQEKRPDLHPSHFLMNLLGLTVFPFIIKPVFQMTGMLSEKAFHARLEERKVLVPKWINSMLKLK